MRCDTCKQPGGADAEAVRSGPGQRGGLSWAWCALSSGDYRTWVGAVVAGYGCVEAGEGRVVMMWGLDWLVLASRWCVRRG
eukprot:8368257-Alexandrium_andersonii.AAC.1